ncbi:Tetratricopeptide repeat [Gaiella occulta]|uniref:Tetratricopeptide repeat n=1 Tax=Gaiella occulta TaxID=1002870 RepID=A0A7M2YY53_9ACTN|nr:tetratricopeptide repeat protein [Gaiella occulta]RDI74408.1 Tetratricopeptide repeat [Gaiella occulta]
MAVSSSGAGAVRGWERALLSEIDAVAAPGMVPWRPVRRYFGIGAFGINAFSAHAGEEVIERHTEEARQHEEAYVVVSGRAAFTLGGDKVDAPAGTIIFVRDPAVDRSAVAEGPETTIVAIGGKRGAPYTVGPWEFVYVARARGNAGDHEGAIDELKRGLEHHPDHRMLLYRLANWEAGAGRTDDALDHLAAAIAGRKALHDQAQSDPAFEAIRTDPRFPSTS